MRVCCSCAYNEAERHVLWLYPYQNRAQQAKTWLGSTSSIDVSSGFHAEHVHTMLHAPMAPHDYATRSHLAHHSTSLSTRNSLVQRARGICSERDSRHLLHRSANTGEREGDGGCRAAGCVSGHHPGQGCSRPRGPHCRARRRHGSCHWLLCAPSAPCSEQQI